MMTRKADISGPQGQKGGREREGGGAAGALAALEAALSYRFARPDLLGAALTHPSLSGARTRKGPGAKVSAYERLEFLGDRVLGLVIAQSLFEMYPNAPEGELAKRHAALVNRDALRAVAMSLGLEGYVRLADGAQAGQARKNLAALSDATEALIGALYLDGGLSAAQRFIAAHWAACLAEAAPADPKTALQEWVQGRGLPLPVYRTVERTGPAHAPHFVVEVDVRGFAPARGQGQSKREAEKAAATLFLTEIGA